MRSPVRAVAMLLLFLFIGIGAVGCVGYYDGYYYPYGYSGYYYHDGDYGDRHDRYYDRRYYRHYRRW